MTSLPQSTQPQNYTLHLEAEGKITLPDHVQAQLGLQQGDRLILTVQEDGTLSLTSLRSQIGKLRGMLKQRQPERKLVDELIQERREEAECE